MFDRIKALVFDLDGVLVDTAKYHFRSWQRLAYELGFSVPEHVTDAVKGLGRLESLEVILGHCPPETRIDRSPEGLQRMTDRKNDIYKAYISNLTADQVLPGVLTFLQEARNRELKLAVGSGSKNARPVLDKLGIAGLFDAVCDGTDITRSKPDPEVFECACRKMGLEPSAVIIFEDAASGIEAAHRCGAIAVGVGDPTILNEAEIVIGGFENLKVTDIAQQLKQRA